MNGLPASIEAYLSDAGFTITELIVLRKLLEGEPLTLRELAAKTGKSTGVLDQAVKKLLQRRIIVRETVNDTGKLLLKSLDSIMDWMKEDTETKLRTMKSRARDFESFVASLKRESSRPDMEYFDETEGIEKAYGKLLGLAGKEMLCFVPATCKEEEDPLCAFRVQYFRERRRRGVFSRVLTQDSPLGRRYRSRDPFEYRETQLIPASVFPITFEKIIAGGIVACFDHGRQRACFLRYQELAETESRMFELLWRRAGEQPTQAQTVAVTLSADPRPLVPFGTRTLSSLREFFLSRKSVALFCVCALMAAGITFGLWRHNYNLNRERVKERAMAIAATAAMEFDARDLDQLHTAEDVSKPEFQKTVKHLQLIRSKNENVKYVYIYRPTGMVNPAWEVVADADYGMSDKDLNGNGIIEESEQLTIPGQKYPHEDPNVQEELIRPTSVFVKDEWGEYYDATAPIFNPQGKAVAILGVDIDLKEVEDLTNASFKVVYSFIGFFLLFVLIRLAAFNRALFLEIWQVLRARKVLPTIALCTEIAFFVTLGMYYYTRNIIREEMGQKLMAVVATAATQFDPDDLNQLHWARDMQTEAYQRVFKKLNEIRDSNHEIRIRWMYILRPATEEYIWEFIADADANFNIPYWRDFNHDGLQTADELGTAPGMQNYQKQTGIADKQLALSRPLVDRTYVIDQWGTYLSASAPIANHAGKPIAIIGVDAELSELLQAHRRKFTFPLWFIGALVLLLSTTIVVRKWK